MAEITIEITDSSSCQWLQPDTCRQAIGIVLQDAGVQRANISLAVVNDVEMAALNEQYLRHHGPTDVLSFLLSDAGKPLDGEIVVSHETAARNAVHFGWSVEQELLLYVVHGALHLVGYDDHLDVDRSAMRCREREVLQQMGIPTTTVVNSVPQDGCLSVGRPELP